MLDSIESIKLLEFVSLSMALKSTTMYLIPATDSTQSPKDIEKLLEIYVKEESIMKLLKFLARCLGSYPSMGYFTICYS